MLKPEGINGHVAIQIDSPEDTVGTLLQDTENYPAGTVVVYSPEARAMILGIENKNYVFVNYDDLVGVLSEST